MRHGFLLLTVQFFMSGRHLRVVPLTVRKYMRLTMRSRGMPLARRPELERYIAKEIPVMKFAPLLLLLLSPFVFATSYDSLCPGSSGIQRYECLTALLSEKQAILDATTKEASRHIENQKDIPDTARVGWLSDLKKANEAWLESRDADCQLLVNQLRGGSASGNTLVACQITNTEARIAFIEQVLSH